MVIFFSALLLLSAAGLVALLAVKRRELATGRIFFSGVRPAAGEMLGEGLHFVERRIPALLRSFSWTLYRRVRAIINFGLAWAMLHAERALERILNVLRHTAHPSGGGEVSAFLREVAEHKRSLQERSGKKPNAIYEE